MPVPYTLVRSDRKTLALVIDREGGLSARAPRRMPLAQIEAFIAEKEGWIHAKQAAVRTQADRARAFAPGGALPLADGPLTLCPAPVSFCFAYHGAFLYPAHQPLCSCLVPWLRERAFLVLAPRLSLWETASGLRAESLAFSTARTRWGSMNAKGNLRLNLALLFCPVPVADYVIVHELAHRKHLNHSPAFWRAVERLMPDYRAKRAWLKENRHLIRVLAAYE